MIAPLVIPGVILGISILLFTNQIGLFFEEKLNLDIKFLRPGFWLVVFGQSSFISTFVALVVTAKLKKNSAEPWRMPPIILERTDFR